MLSDHAITIAGRSFPITSHDMFMAGVLLAIGLLLWISIYFSRKRIVVLKMSSGTDQITIELSRIADALDRIANRRPDRAIASASATRDIPHATDATAPAAATAAPNGVKKNRIFHVWALKETLGSAPDSAVGRMVRRSACLRVCFRGTVISERLKR